MPTTKNTYRWLWSPAVLAISAVLLMLWGAIYFRPDDFPPDDPISLLVGFLLMLVGGLFLLAALYTSHTPARWPRLTRTVAYPFTTKLSPGNVVAILLGGAALATLTLTNLNPPLLTLSYDIQFGLFGIGILAIIFGLGLTARTVLTHFNKVFVWELFLLCLITLLAFGLQLYRLEGEVHTPIDEFHTMQAVLDLGQNIYMRGLSPYADGASSPWLFPYLQTGALAIFGHTFLGLRFVSILFGSFTVPALYVLAKALFDRPTAFIAALFLATFPPFIHLSRLAMVNAADPFIGTMLLAMLARSLKSNRRVDFVLAGIFLALTQYFYDGGKMLYPALVAVWLLILLITTRRQVLWQGIGLMLLTALLVAGPIFLTWWSSNLPLFPRMTHVATPSIDWGTILSLRDNGAALQRYLIHNLLPPFLHIVQLPDNSHFYYGGQTPLILGFMLPGFFLGLFQAFWRWRIAGSLLLLWVVLTVAGNSLLIEGTNTWSARFMVVLPVLALLMALGLRFTLPLLKINVRRFIPRMPTIGQEWQWIGAGVLVLALAALQPIYYFRDHLPVYNEQIRPFIDPIDAFDRARSLPPDTTVILVTDTQPYTDKFFILADFWNFHPLMVILKSAELSPDYLSGLSAGGYAIFITPDNSTSPELLRSTFANIEGPQYSPYNVPLDRQYALYYLPPRAP